MVEVLGGRAHTTGGWSWLLKKRDGVRSGPLIYTLCRGVADIRTRRGSEQKSVDPVYSESTADLLDAIAIGFRPDIGWIGVKPCMGLEAKNNISIKNTRDRESTNMRDKLRRTEGLLTKTNSCA